MPSHKSAIKRVKQSKKRALRNKMVVSGLKTSIKKIYSLIEKKDVEQVAKMMPKAIADIDKASSKGVIHKNASSRKVSRLVKRANALMSKTA